MGNLLKQIKVGVFYKFPTYTEYQCENAKRKFSCINPCKYWLLKPQNGWQVGYVVTGTEIQVPIALWKKNKVRVGCS